jgi:hypothetical protein
MPLATQKDALNRFIHRFTGDHKPLWANKPMNNGKAYPLQFKDDTEWLNNTMFTVRNDGKLANNVHYCQSNPTFPNGKE